MSNIKPVIYHEIDPSIAPTKAMAEYYFHANLMTVNGDTMRKYTEFNMNQYHVKNNAIQDAWKELGWDPKTIGSRKSTLGISSMSDRVFVIVDMYQ